MERDIVDIDLGVIDISSLDELAAGSAGYEMTLQRALSSLKVTDSVANDQISAQLRFSDMWDKLELAERRISGKIPAPPEKWIYGDNVASERFVDFDFRNGTNPQMTYGYLQLSNVAISGNYPMSVKTAMESVFGKNVIASIQSKNLSSSQALARNQRISSMQAVNAGISQKVTSKDGLFSDVSST